MNPIAGHPGTAAGTVAVVASRIRLEEKALLDALSRRAVDSEVVDDRSIVYRVGAPRPRWRAVLNRSLSATRRLEVSRWCAAVGVPVLNTPETVALCDNKIATAFALDRARVPTPDTVVSLAPSSGGRAADEVGYPAVVKPVNGSWGRGLARVGDRETAETLFGLRDQLASPSQKLTCVQEFVPGRDLRVLVVGGSAVAAMARESDDWVRNVALGSTAVPRRLDDSLVELAERSAAAVGGGVLGVDLLETDDGRLFVLEVNSAVEFRGLGEANPGVSVADAIVDHLLRETVS
ncbi:RimK family alpha-L-glutamate ligase [Nocardiopsis valliformis]|uniref:RimK family alpha-L-glutamate ligase n=1 Tax=Nocardiopsis valliformis TaxID=239974 RepID=UPI00035DC4AA|nr:RimK family alpha-L-glutamate ligase [Nocardiopsis valliformis]